MSKKLRIGGASGFWGDSVIATPQLLNGNDLDFIVYDYLAEITMSIMAVSYTHLRAHETSLHLVCRLLL